MSKSAPSNSRALGSAAKGSGQFAMLLLSMCAFALYFIFSYSAYNLRRYVIINSAEWYTKSARIKNNDNNNIANCPDPFAADPIALLLDGADLLMIQVLRLALTVAKVVRCTFLVGMLLNIAVKT